MPDTDIGGLLGSIRPRVQAKAPELLRLFDTFAAEAIFGRAWLRPRLERLPRGSRVLEIGAGLMLLATQLAREGFDVVALEPVGSGFSDFHVLQAIVREYAQEEGIAVAVLAYPVEDLHQSASYDFAYSINVMEHVGDVAAAIANVTRALKPGATYSFTCPNYRFPYEPHFGVPIVGSKKITERLFGRAIRQSPRVVDPAGLWASLNWISVSMINRICGELRDVEWRYDRSFLARAFQRVTQDPEFAGRRARWMRVLSSVLVGFRLHRLAATIPPSLQPVIDCSVTRRAL